MVTYCVKGGITTTIPIEDFVYLLGMLLPAFTIYQWLLHRVWLCQAEGPNETGEGQWVIN